MTGKKSSPRETHTHLAMKVDRYEVRSEAGMNLNLKMARPLDDCDDEPVFTAETWLEIHGTCTSPADRAGQMFEITIAGGESSRFRLTMKDIQERDEYRSPVYRQYRGAQIAVYRRPKGIALLDRPRATGEWSVWVRVDPRLANDWLTILGSSRDLFLAIHELQQRRDRWIQGIALQTKDPALE